jgi:hypothetical protein
MAEAATHFFRLPRDASTVLFIGIPVGKRERRRGGGTCLNIVAKVTILAREEFLLRKGAEC